MTPHPYIDDKVGVGYNPSALLRELRYGEERYRVCDLCGEDPKDCWCGEEFCES